MPWSELLELHVVRKAREILGQRWNLGFGYADAKAGEVRPPRTPHQAVTHGICYVIQNRDAGERGCAATARETLGRLAGRDTAIEITCHAGLREIAAPISIDGDYYGALFCGGYFHADQSRDQAVATVDQRTAPLALGPDAYRDAKQHHPTITAADVSFARELLVAAASEIAAYHGANLRKSRPTGDLESPFATRYSYDSIIGRSTPMQDLYSVLDKVVHSDSTVLVQGENGTGKELVARAIHYNSPRKHRRFVVTNCSAFNDNLLDSELFGHVKGAFTGAIADKQGLFEAADNGTFFLDEIGDMSPALQVKVLRVLQEGTFTPVGDTDMRAVDVRIIAATNRDLRAMVENGQFREDLYYRINVINLLIPPLRERREDIELLVDSFLKKHSRGRMRAKTLSDACHQRLISYRWPGNVRELENEIERLVVLAGDERVIPEDLLSPRIRAHVRGNDPLAEPVTSSLPDAVRSLERRMIHEALERNNWNKTRASAELKISRRNLIRLVQKYELEA